MSVDRTANQGKVREDCEKKGFAMKKANRQDSQERPLDYFGPIVTKSLAGVSLINIIVVLIAYLYATINGATVKVGFEGWRLTTEVIGGGAPVQRLASTRRWSVWDCCNIISVELATTGSIDTNLPSPDDSTKDVYKCVQVCLKAIGCYDGGIDGDPTRTKEATTKFQRDNKLKVDGKIGRDTWRTMLIMLTQVIYGKAPP